MSNAVPSRLGQINGSGDANALFLKVFSGEILNAFNRATVFADKHSVRSISSGKAAQFPATGKTTSGYHTPGTEILGTPINANEQVITIDDILFSSVFMADIDEAKNHYDVRSEYSRQLGDTLAQTYDRNVARTGIKAARSANPVTGLDGGSVILQSTMHTSSDELGKALFAAAQKLDEKDVPEMERYAFLRPAQYYLAVQNKDLINKDYAGLGSIAKGTIESIAGLTIVKTNNLPDTDLRQSTGSPDTLGIPNKYRANYADTVFLVMGKGAVGTVKLLDLKVESEYDLRRLGTLVVARYAVGHGVLRPNLAVEGSKAATAPNNDETKA